MIKAIAYGRYSSDRQREESIEAQLRSIHDYAKTNNMIIVKEYIDRAATGTSDEREAFKNMIRDSERKLFEVVLVHKVDRFARNRYDSAIYKRKLRENGVKVIYVSQPISEGPEGAMMEAMLEGMAEYYSRNLAQEVMKGLKENAYDCKFCGGIPPLGYDVDSSKKYIINQVEASVVKLIYNLYLQGCGYTEIIKELNNKGFTTKTGHKFGKNSVYEILRNEKYTGTYMFNKAARKINGKFNRHTQKDNKDIIKVEGGMPEIVPSKMWDGVQSIMDSRIRQGHKPKEIYLLSGLLHCGICGSAMTSDTRRLKDREKIYYYYRCYRNNGKNECNLQAWNRDDLENAVIEKYEHGLFAGETLDAIADRLMKYYEEHETSLNDDLSKLRFELTGVKKKIGNMVEAIADGAGFESLKEKLASLELQKNQYENKIDEIENTKKFSIPSRENIKTYMSKHGDLRKMSRDDLKAFLNEKIRGIRVFPDHIDVDSIVNPIGCGRPYTITFTIAV